MQIVDECNVINHICKLATEDATCEHCAVAVASYFSPTNQNKCKMIEYCMIQELGGITEKYASIIPARVSYALLGICKRDGRIPVIVHSHLPGCTDRLCFSPQDKLFISQFMQCAKGIGNIPVCFFAVTDGSTIECCIGNVATMASTYEEAIIV